MGQIGRLDTGSRECFSSISAFALAVSLAAASPALAQEAATQEQPASEEEANANDIVVTATRQGQRVQDAPISVSVIDERLIEGAGATNFSELATLVPSVVFSQSQSPIQSNVGIRGVTTAGGSAALEPSVGIYIDGVFTDRTSIGIGDFNDIERVEVLRGPQGTLFGNSSPAGIINFVTKRPRYRFGADAAVTIGSFDRRQLSASVTGPIVADKLAFRLSGFRHKRDGYLENLSGNDRNDQNSWGVRGKLLFDLSPEFSLLMTMEHGRNDQACCAPITDDLSAATLARFAAASQGFPFTGSGVPFPDNQLDDQVVSIDYPQRYKNRISAATLDATYDFGTVRLSSVTALRSFTSFEQQDLDFSPIDLLRFPEGRRKQDQFSQELRLTSDTNRRFSYLLGAYYFEKVARERAQGLIINPSLIAFVGSILPASSPSGSDVKNRNYAVFGEGTFKVTDQLSLTGGLRYNYDRKEIEAFADRLRANGTPLSPRQIIPEQFQKRSGGKLTGRAIAQYEFTRDAQAYVSYTRGYKAFGINDDANLLRNVPGASFFFDSEKVDNYELGLKTYLRAARLTANFVLFNTKYSDFQALSSFTDSNNTLRFFLQNAAELTSRGVEADLSWRPSERFTMQGSATILDATFDSFPNAQGPNGLQNLTGERLRDAPKFSGSLSAQYDQPLTASLKAFVRGDVFRRSKVFTNQNLDPLEVQPGYTKINGRIGVGHPDDRWSIELFGRNLTNKITFTRAGVPLFGALNGVLPLLGIPAFPTGQSRIKFVEEPRTYGVTARFRFGG